MKSEKLKEENEEKGDEKGKMTSEMEHKSDLNLNLNSFSSKKFGRSKIKLQLCSNSSRHAS